MHLLCCVSDTIPPLDPHGRESADRVVLHTGKYEELIVCSHEIAASTAQLVAASKVGVPAGSSGCLLTLSHPLCQSCSLQEQGEGKLLPFSSL